MIRKNWSPGGGDKSLRGRDRWVRISWDQALDIVASETRRITGKYGQDALWLTGKPSDNPHYHKDRKSVVEGKRVPVRVDFGGRRPNKKTKITTISTQKPYN